MGMKQLVIVVSSGERQTNKKKIEIRFADGGSEKAAGPPCACATVAKSFFFSILFVLFHLIRLEKIPKKVFVLLMLG